MKPKKINILLYAALVGGLCAGAASADTVTTNNYDEASTSDDIALSCSAFDVRAGTGIVDAQCNHENTDGDVIQVDTLIDVAKLIMCSSNEGEYDFAWDTGSEDSAATPADLDVGVSSDGNDYMIEGKCVEGENRLDATPLDLGDTSDGLKNNNGSLDLRNSR